MKKFGLAKYVVPSIIAMVLVGTYTNIDGLFIGNRTGDDGLAAINVAWPIVAYITSLGTALGMGASVEINNFRGQGQNQLAEKIKNTALLVLFAAGALATAFCLAVYSPLLKLLGASGDVMTYAKNYALVISLGSVFQVVGAGVVVLLRNDGKTFLSAVYTAVGLAVHVGLDFVLVNKYALYGVAASTVVSQAVVAVLGLFSFIKNKKIIAVLDATENSEKIDDISENFAENNKNVIKNKDKKFPCLKRVIKNSFAPLGLNFAPSAALTFTNIFALKEGGVAAVSAYAVMSYVLYTYDYVYQGVCDGVQPLLSYYEGAGDRLNSAKTVRSSCILLAVFSVVFATLTPAAIAFLPGIFSVSAEAEAMMKVGFIIYAFAYPLKAAVKFSCAYFYSTGKTACANFIAYADPLLFTPLFLLLSLVTGINGVWAALTLSQAATCVLAVILLMVYKRYKTNKSAYKSVNE